MTKVLILQESIPEYRVPVFRRLAEKYDLTVVYTNSKYNNVHFPFTTVYLQMYKIGPFKLVGGLRRICKNFDIVIYMPNLHFIDYCLIPVLPHKYKTISFGMGFRASYSKHYDLNKKKDILDRVFGYFVFKGDAAIVYFKEVLKFWRGGEVLKTKCFETRNTVEVLSLLNYKVRKKTILFVGTLYKEKKVDILIRAFKDVMNSSVKKDLPILKIVGGGNMMEDLKNMVNSLDLNDHVVLTGPIYDESVIARYFLEALVCVSPNQAGLSVPHSMGYGVPFVTTKDAITGGEILHINNGFNGILMNDLSELTGVLKDVCDNPKKYVEMGARARDYYNSYASIDVMIKGFDDAIKFVLNS